ncbi:ETS homologous factor-like [Homarus americanus]|uniref:ETSous factor-like 7 n=1 Tax=Homarus americanus TaxID=6706 RepID=A0A8J5ML69_HOMAM|nr:ETS homologous factor-like [Homarus americanus]KAG7155451.1 ETSous factor-like 7 [Homarus americanus]
MLYSSPKPTACGKRTWWEIENGLSPEASPTRITRRGRMCNDHGAQQEDGYQRVISNFLETLHLPDVEAPYEPVIESINPDDDVRPLNISHSLPTPCGKVTPFIVAPLPVVQINTMASDQITGSLSQEVAGPQPQQPPAKRRPGRPPKPKQQLQPKKIPKIWEFVHDMLQDPATCPSVVRWEDEKNGIFRFIDPKKAASLWGDLKENPKMSYEKMSRALRYHYTSEALDVVRNRRLVYKFGKKAHKNNKKLTPLL